LRPPHRFPFELVDRAAGGAASATVSAGSWWLRGETPLTLPWVIEAAAQAATGLVPPASGARELALVAIDEASLARPVEAGERVELVVRLAGRIGELVRVEGEVRADGAALGRLRLTLAAAAQPADSRVSRS
jgi:hypothetical protein